MLILVIYHSAYTILKLCFYERNILGMMMIMMTQCSSFASMSGIYWYGDDNDDTILKLL